MYLCVIIDVVKIVDKVTIDKESSLPEIGNEPS